MKKIIFILGSGHSGSTVLDKALGSFPRSHSLGEIFFFSRIITSDTLCSCGKKYSHCPFWKTKRKLFCTKHSIKEESIKKFRMHLLPFGEGGIFYRLLDTIDLTLNLLGFSILLNNENKKIIKNNIFVFDLFQHETQIDYLIDSSKNFRRALFLKNKLKNKSIFLHLIRDGRAVIFSYLKKTYKVISTDEAGELQTREYKRKESNPHTIIKNWKRLNTFLYYYFKYFLSPKSSYLIRHEDFAATPQKTFQKMSDQLGLQLNVDALDLTTESHMVGGNSSRINAKNIHAPSYKWKTGLEKGIRQNFEKAAGNLLSKFNYPV